MFCEWNGEQWERKYFFSGVKMMPNATYGDIFYKELGERRNIRFVRRNEKKSYKNVIERGRKDAKDVIGDIFVARIFVLDV